MNYNSNFPLNQEEKLRSFNKMFFRITLALPTIY